MNPEELHDLAPLYVAGALTAGEETAFEAHLPDCERCQGEVRGYTEAVTKALEVDVDASTGPPPDLRARVLSAVAATPQVDRTETRTPSENGALQETVLVDLSVRRRRRERTLLAAAAGLMILVGAVVAGLQLLPDDPVELLAEASDAETILLEGDGGELTVVYSRSLDQVALIGDGLGDPGDGRVYELWFVNAEGVSPATLFKPDSGSIREVFPVDDQQDTAGFGVTIEPAGGSEQPTGDILLVGTFDA